MFSSIFNTYHGAPILCCTTTDLYIFYVKQGFFGAVLGILGVAFVTALVLTEGQQVYGRSDDNLACPVMRSH